MVFFVKSLLTLLAPAVIVSALSVSRFSHDVHQPRELSQNGLPIVRRIPDSDDGSVDPDSDGSDGGGDPGYLSGTQYGQGTFFNTGLGACGYVNSDSDHIAAVSVDLFNSYPGYDGVNPNNNPICGRQVIAHYEEKSTTVTIMDSCPGCALTDLDFTPTAFSDLANQDLGRINISWEWA
ncbi:RlpA-like double-psi beta-barrel-protein domain-containing protein-containing protein [Scleroderma citrinum]